MLSTDEVPMIEPYPHEAPLAAASMVRGKSEPVGSAELVEPLAEVPAGDQPHDRLIARLRSLARDSLRAVVAPRQRAVRQVRSAPSAPRMHAPPAPHLPVDARHPI